MTRGPRIPRPSGALLILCIATLPGGPALAAAPQPDTAGVRLELRAGPEPDTVGVRLELGASTDFTNEEFYEYRDAFVDSIAIGRRLVGSPETRGAGVLLASVAGTRRRGAAAYVLQNELSLGDKVQRGSIGLTWRDDPSPGWRLYAAPRVEYRHDRTFDRDLGEWRGAASARLRHGFLESRFAELGATGELLRTRGQGALFLLDRNAARASVALEGAPLFGPEWRLGYSLAVREFPDSSERDHVEHGWEGRWRRDFAAGHSLSFETEGARRQTRSSSPTTRDRFVEGEGAVEADLRFGESVSLRSHAMVEAIHYDRGDDTLFFDYRIVRARLGPRFGQGPGSASLGPRAEWLASPNHSEEYFEVGGFAELEYLGGSAWWSVTPAAGWRDYSERSTPRTPALHSSYAFYEMGVLGEQPIAGDLRLRLSASVRFESHVDSLQDARSLYFSLDLRKLL